MNNKPDSPFKIIVKKLFKNIPATMGFLVIVFAVLVAVFGVLFIPDNSLNANETASELRKLPSGTTVTFIKPKKGFQVKESSGIAQVFLGKVPDYLLLSIKEYTIINGTELHFTTYVGGQEQLPLVKFYKGVQKDDKGQWYQVEGENVSFLGLDKQRETVTKTELKSYFEQYGIEKRTFTLGTDSAGRDTFSRLVYGAKVSVSVGFVSVIISLIVGIFIGAVAGYSKGWVDSVLMWLVTVVWSIPGIMIIIAISLALNSKGIWVVFIAVGLTMWVDVARVVRGQFLEAREYLYVEAAKALGVSSTRIVLRHILPNISGPIIVMATANFASAILIEAGLSFIGIGVEPPTPSWGAMVREGYNLMSADIMGDSGAFGVLLYPSLCISLLVFAFNLFGNGIRDAIDPKN
jgi:peptide/nickel transport system permease protein